MKENDPLAQYIVKLSENFEVPLNHEDILQQFVGGTPRNKTIDPQLAQAVGEVMSFLFLVDSEYRDLEPLSRPKTARR